jgi:carbon monoxide dehydrogenase subunit G
MRLSLTTLLDAPTERAWRHLQKPTLLEFVAAPLLTFDPLDPSSFPETFEDGDEILVDLKLLGWIPLGTQTIRVAVGDVDDTPGARLYTMRDEGTGEVASTWDHTITLRETPDGKTAYTDEVDVDAGVLTPFVWLFAHAFYRYRQARWRTLVEDDFDPLE